MRKREFGIRNSELKGRWITPLICFFLLLGTCHLPLSAQQTPKQKKDQLQAQMKKLQDEIKLISTALKNTSAKKEKNMGEILSLQAKIKSRKKLIDNIS